MIRKIQQTGPLPAALYRAEQVRELDRIAIEDHAIPGHTLMERAGEAGYELMEKTWPGLKEIAVVCGIGNNGGDGYVLARLAREAGLTCHLYQLGDASRIGGDALSCVEAYRACGGEVEPFGPIPDSVQLIVDGVFGTGLERAVEGEWKDAVEAMNTHPAPLLALDIPSGLHSDSGEILGIAADAAATISFIGLKQGLFTGRGPDSCGSIAFNDLGVPAEIYQGVRPAAWRINWAQQRRQLKPRQRSAHKGDFGHLLVIGGDHGYAGAVRMAAEAAARVGAGLVSVATREAHAAVIATARPELMCRGVESPEQLAPLLERASVVAIGPGLGQGPWGLSLLGRVLEQKLPMVLDADALNLLAADPAVRDNWVLTPHPGEAGRLLGISTSEVQSDRFAAVSRLQEKYAGCVLLKGAGTLIHSGTEQPLVCTNGNPGMATGGTGDVLTGIIGGLIAQGFDPADAAAAGACLHGAAGDRVALVGERGMLATDLIPQLRKLVNPEVDR
ncbi:MAG: NAD(P)H-hydrate dehydratase [Candidatus Sedimenticola sp. PURPLELP]